MTDKEVKEVIEIMNDAENVDDLRVSFINYAKHSQVGISIKEIIDILNYQQAEIERLEVRLRKERHQFEDLGKMYSEIRAEAIKEFAERLKDDSWFTDLYDRNDYPVRAVTKEDIDNLAKEMVEKIMAERIGRFVIYTADDEIPDCMCCDRCDSDFDCCNSCGAEYGWFGYRRTERVRISEKFMEIS